MKAFLIFASLFFNFQVRAQSRCSQVYETPAMEAVIVAEMQAMKQDQTYEPGFCEVNVHRLIERLNTKGVDLSRSQALFLMSFKGPDYVLEMRSATVREDIWDYHVVLQHQGKIFDFDYTGVHQSPVSYFQIMFHARASQTQGIHVRPIEALEYLRDFKDHRDYASMFARGWSPRLGEHRDFQYYVEFTESHPLFGLDQYLRRVE